MNASNPGIGTLLELQNTNTAEVRVGSASNARMGIGATPQVGFHLVVGGASKFGWVIVNQNMTVTNDFFVKTNGRSFQRADANNSMNIISTEEINFSLQSNRTADPTTGTIALQLHDTNGITINRAVVNNQTFNGIGNITAEANLNVWGEVLFQHSSSIKKTLNGSDYDLDIRNGDTDRATNLIVGTIGSTPEIAVKEATINMLGHLNITHSTAATSERVKRDNPDADGLIYLSINGANICEVSSAGLHVNGTATETSDERLKDNIKEISSKTCYDVVKYSKPKEFNFKGKEEREIGFIA